MFELAQLLRELYGKCLDNSLKLASYLENVSIINSWASLHNFLLGEQQLMGICTTDFSGTWNVTYNTEPEYSGKMFIKVELGGVEVNGEIYKNGKLDGTYICTAERCDVGSRTMEMRYLITPVGQPDRVWTGYLQIAVFQQTPEYGQGYYIDDVDGGDRGKISLQKLGAATPFNISNGFFGRSTDE
jgi:hypothetical protein